jgi:thioesterase domain-containing protein
LSGEDVPASIEAMARDRLPVILEVQPSGPYLLGGHCMGALVAFETARLLTKAQHKVDLVVMIDPVVVSLRPSARLIFFASHLALRARGVSSESYLRSLAATWKKAMQHESSLRQYKLQLKRRFFSESFAPRTERRQPFRAPNQNTNLAYARAMLSYKPDPLSVPILYFALQYSGAGWRGMSPQIEFIDAPDLNHQLTGEAGSFVMTLIRHRLDALDQK